MSSIQSPDAVLTNRVSFETEFQADEFTCGPVCAMMVLSWFGITGLDPEILLEEIEDIGTIDTKRWVASPDGMKNLINKHIENNQPSGYSGQFKVYFRGEQEGIDSRLVWSLHSFKVPCIVLKGGDRHWIVTYGYTPLSVAPNEPTDAVDVTGFYIRDPIEDNTQGHIPYRSWVDDYTDPVPGGHWRGKFLAICDPSSDDKSGKKVPAKGKEKIPEGTSFNLSKPIPDKTIPFSNSEKENFDKFKKFKAKILPAPVITFTKNPVRDELIISKKSAGDYAIWVMHSQDFYNPVMLNYMMTNPQPGSPYLIEYLGTEDFYYLVPVKDKNGKTYAIISINAGKPEYRRSMYAMGFDKPIRLKPLSPGEIKKILAKGKYASPEQIEKLQVRETLVWKFCNQSLTPFLPFHRIKLGGKNWYMRIDGKLYKRLTKD